MSGRTGGTTLVRRATASGAARIRAGGLQRDVTFAEPAPGVPAGLPTTLSTTGTGPRSWAPSLVPGSRGRNDQACAGFIDPLVKRLGPDPPAL